MVIQTRPDNQVFASGAKPGEVALFPDILRGWGITLEQTEGKPPLEWMNGVMQRFDKGIQYALQRGIPEWHKTTDYPAYAVVQHAGLFYVSVQSNAGTTPGTDAEKWGVFWDGIPRLKMYKTLPLTNEGDIHLLGLGAHTWSSQQNKYIPINQPAKRVGMLETFFSRQHLQKEGGTPRDGQLVPRALFQDFVREYLDNGVLPCAPNDAAWLGDTSLRTQWVANDGKGNFRVPDWNGKQPGSVAVYGGRGDGAKSNGLHGKIQLDQMQNMQWSFDPGSGNLGARLVSNTSTNPATGGIRVEPISGNNTLDHVAWNSTNYIGSVSYDAARDARLRVGDETRVTAPTVVWGVYLSNNSETTLSPAQVDILLGQYNVLNSELQQLKTGIDEVVLYPGGTAQNPGVIAVGGRIEIDNPFPGSRVWAEILTRVDGDWGTAGWLSAPQSNAGSYGAIATSANGGKLIVVVGSLATYADYRLSGSSHKSFATITTPLPYLVVVRRIK